MSSILILKYGEGGSQIFKNSLEVKICNSYKSITGMHYLTSLCNFIHLQNILN